jgi:hypothetical protein
LPPNAGIGCFHAGIPLFFGSRQVVALDGLVNHRARMLRSEHRFEAFLRESLLDEMSAVTAYDHPLGVRLTGSYGWPHLWRLLLRRMRPARAARVDPSFHIPDRG